MLIGELSIKTGLSRDTIRFYEKEGLISVGRKQRRDNNYKEYDETVLQRLHLIKRIKNFGFTLHEAADLLSLIAVNAATCDEVRSHTTKKIAVIDSKVADLLQLREQLNSNMKTCRDSCQPIGDDENCPIIIQGT
ncbi:MAG TPA: MerR family transcriptional regulator [Candidatus Babeliaceae bacterium]|nr:MerR family transcriptional regulator [Candidatus Babeliaceae bacterium]